MEIRGAFRDRLSRPGRAPVEAPWQPNLVLWSALDLIGSLLCNRSQGVAFLAVGSGDPAWDSKPPKPDKGRTQLTAEVHRVRLVPGETLSYDRSTGRLGRLARNRRFRTAGHISVRPRPASAPGSPGCV